MAAGAATVESAGYGGRPDLGFLHSSFPLEGQSKLAAGTTGPNSRTILAAGTNSQNSHKSHPRRRLNPRRIAGAGGPAAELDACHASSDGKAARRRFLRLAVPGDAEAFDAIAREGARSHAARY